MQYALQELARAGEMAVWICPDCMVKAMQSARDLRIKAELMGYYQEGQCQRPSCDRAPGYSPILQLLAVVGTVMP